MVLCTIEHMRETDVCHLVNQPSIFFWNALEVIKAKEDKSWTHEGTRWDFFSLSFYSSVDSFWCHSCGSLVSLKAVFYNHLIDLD